MLLLPAALYTNVAALCLPTGGGGGSPISFGSIGVRSSVSATAASDVVSPALPAGTAAGDLLVILASSTRDASTYSSDQSYTTTHTYQKLGIMEKVAGGSEVAPTITIDGLTVGDLISAVILRFPSALSTKDWSDDTGGTGSTTLTGPALTVTDQGSAGVVVGFQPNDKAGSTFTANGWTEREYSTTTTGADGTFYIATLDNMNSGSQTMPSWSWSGGLEYRAISFSVSGV